MRRILLSLAMVAPLLLAASPAHALDFELRPKLETPPLFDDEAADVEGLIIYGGNCWSPREAHPDQERPATNVKYVSL